MKSDDFSSINLARFEELHSWESRYRELIAWSKLIQTKPEIRREEFKIKGCASNAWLICKKNDFGENCYFFDSESSFIKGLAALLFSQIDQCKKEEIEGVEIMTILSKLGLEKRMTVSRANGFRALVNQAYNLAGIT